VFTVDKKWHNTNKNHTNDLSGKGIWDSGCRRTVAGSWWLENFRQEAESRGHKMEYEKDDAVFRFGNQGLLKSGRRWRLPVSLYGVSGNLLVNEVEGGCPLLISEVSMTTLDVSIHFGKKTIDVGAIDLTNQPLERSRLGPLGCFFVARGVVVELGRAQQGDS
jgi:hypothetical protein